MISKDLISLIDIAVSRDFIIHPVSDQDRKNDSYKALEFTLAFNNIKIQYERKVETINFPIIPQFQFLFGFYPKDGLCLFVKKKEHKIALCDGPLDKMAGTCSLVHSLIYLLVPLDRFEVFSYLPACCQINCSNSPKQYDLRIQMWK